MDLILQDLGALIRDHWWWLLPTVVLLGAGGGAFLVAGVSNSLIHTTLLRVAAGAVVGGLAGGGLLSGLASLGGAATIAAAPLRWEHRLLVCQPAGQGIIVRLREGPDDPGRRLAFDPRSADWVRDLTALAAADRRPLRLSCHPQLPMPARQRLEQQASELGIPAVPWDAQPAP